MTLFNNTIMENIRLGRKNATDEEVLVAAKLANCDEFAEKLPDKWNGRLVKTAANSLAASASAWAI